MYANHEAETAITNNIPSHDLMSKRLTLVQLVLDSNHLLNRILHEKQHGRKRRFSRTTMDTHGTFGCSRMKIEMIIFPDDTVHKHCSQGMTYVYQQLKRKLWIYYYSDHQG